MYLHTVRVELSHLHGTILRVDIVATKVAWESAKALFSSTRVVLLTCILLLFKRCIKENKISFGLLVIAEILQLQEVK